MVPKLLVDYHPQITRITAKYLVKIDNMISAIGNWEWSDSGVKLLSKYPAIRPESFLDNTARLPRAHATLLFRHITGPHTQLRRHLHKLQPVDSPVCQGCGEAQESVVHFLSRCLKYEAIRQEVLASKGRGFLSIPFLLSDFSALPAPFDYTRRTFRFSDLIA